MWKMRAGVVLVALGVAAGCTKLVDLSNVEVARVDGEKIRLGDVLERIRLSPPQTRLRANTPEGRAGILEDLVSELVLVQAAAAQGITVEAAEVEARLEAERGQVRQARTAPGQDAIVELTSDPETVARKLRIDKLLESRLNETQVQARYHAMRAGPPQPTVQYDFMNVRAANPNLAIEVENALAAGRDIMQLVQTYQGHPDFVNGGRVDPVYIRMLDPWFQREMPRHERGDVLPPYQTGRMGEPTMMLVRLRELWAYPPYEVVHPTLVEELYAEYLVELKARFTIERFPERLHLIDRL